MSSKDNTKSQLPSAHQLGIAVLEISRMSDWLSDAIRSASRMSGLSLAEGRILTFIDQCGAISTSDLRRASRLPRSTMASSLIKLQTSGLITVNEIPTDKRVRRAAITVSGRRKVAEICIQIGNASKPYIVGDIDEANQLLRKVSRTLLIG
jgi:DNA-binding MarR family transcriptional regulator